MPMTITQKILAAHAGKDRVEPGEFIEAKVDIALGNDITAPIAISEFGKNITRTKRFRDTGKKTVWDREKVVIVPDHFTPNKDIKSAAQSKILREFAREQELKYYFEVGQAGIEHALLPEKGIVRPGQLIIGADSHTCTYGGLGAFATGVGSTDLAAAMLKGTVWLKVPEAIRFRYEGRFGPWVSGKDLILYTIGRIGVSGALYRTMEFTGPAITALSVEGRLTMANMAIEAGAKNGIFAVDRKTEDFVKNATAEPYAVYASDPDAEYAGEVEIDVSAIEPQVSFPHLPENAKSVKEAGKIKIDQSVIGSCTNGRMEDLRTAAGILQGRKVHKHVRAIILPGTQDIYLQAVKEGLVEIFVKAGAVMSPPTCGPCLGGHMGVLAEGEKAVATTNRNFVGRMGHTKSEVYLAGPAVAAASAVAGYICHPDEVKG